MPDGAVLIDQPGAETVAAVADDEGEAWRDFWGVQCTRAVHGLGGGRPVERGWAQIGLVGAIERIRGAGELIVGKEPVGADEEASAERHRQQSCREQQRRQQVEEGASGHVARIDSGV